MGFFGMLFWVAVLWFAIRAWRRSQGCVPMGSRGYAPGWYTGGYRYGGSSSPPAPAPPSDREEYIESLETRLTELEERLDFTERLLASRQEPATPR
jgi:hypothetical protein